MATSEDIEAMQLSEAESGIPNLASNEGIDAAFNQLVKEILATASAHNADFIQRMWPI